MFVNQEWKDVAAELDAHLEFNDWKAHDEDLFYDWRLVRKVLKIILSLVSV